jgi:hypothetical protein
MMDIVIVLSMGSMNQEPMLVRDHEIGLVLWRLKRQGTIWEHIGTSKTPPPLSQLTSTDQLILLRITAP